MKLAFALLVATLALVSAKDGDGTCFYNAAGDPALNDECVDVNGAVLAGVYCDPSTPPPLDDGEIPVPGEGTCKPCTVCGAGQTTLTACSPFANTVCGCPANCTTCGAGGCTACAAGFSLNAGVCVANPPPARTCPIGCSTCSGTRCTACLPGYRLSLGTCRPTIITAGTTGNTRSPPPPPRNGGRRLV